jgi:hypothetical protein
MTSLTKTLRTTVVALVAGTFIASSVWAKGPGGASSRVSGHTSISSGISTSASSVPYTHKQADSTATSNSTANSTSGTIHDANMKVPVYRSTNVMREDNSSLTPILGGGPFTPIYLLAHDPDAEHDPKHLTNGKDSQYGDGGVMPTYPRPGSSGQPLTVTFNLDPSKFAAPGSSSMASIANNKAKYYDRNAYIKPSNKNLVSKEIEKKYNDSHPIAQKNKVTGGGSSSNNQSGGSNGGGSNGTSGGDNGGSNGSNTSGSTSKKPHKCCPMPCPFPFPLPIGGCGDGSCDGGYSDGSCDNVCPAVYSSDNSTPAGVTTASAAMPVADSGIDLVLEDVKLAAPATLVAGPAYTVTLRNQGMAPAGQFVVAVLAGLDGKLAQNAPRGGIEVSSLAAGEVKEVTLRLPQKALQFAGPDGQPTAFTHLFVAVDPMNAVAETDKTNNTAVVERAALEGGAPAN